MLAATYSLAFDVARGACFWAVWKGATRSMPRNPPLAHGWTSSEQESRASARRAARSAGLTPLETVGLAAPLLQQRAYAADGLDPEERAWRHRARPAMIRAVPAPAASPRASRLPSKPPFFLSWKKTPRAGRGGDLCGHSAVEGQALLTPFVARSVCADGQFRQQDLYQVASSICPSCMTDGADPSRRSGFWRNLRYRFEQLERGSLSTPGATMVLEYRAWIEDQVRLRVPESAEAPAARPLAAGERR